MLQQIALGGTMIALPIFLQMVLEYNAHGGGPVARAAVADACSRVALVAGKRAGDRRPSSHHPRRVRAARRRAASCCSRSCRGPTPGWCLVVPLIIAGVAASACSCRSSTTTRSRRSPRSGSARPPASTRPAGSFGLSFGLAFAGAIMLATLSFAFTDMADDSTVLPPAEQEQVADVLEDDAEVMSNTAARGAARRPAAGRSRTRSSASTPTPGRSRCRSRCSIPSSPRCSACSTRSG